MSNSASPEELLKKIYKLTVSQKIQWKETTDENTFLASFPNYSISISQDFDLEVEEYYRTLAIHNNKGKIVENFYTNSFPNIKESSSMLHAIWNAARRQARGLDKAIETLNSILDSLE